MARQVTKQWRRGVSFGSAGRLGAHAAGYEPAENGYLTYQTTGASFLLIGPARQVIGSLQLPPRHSVRERTASWTLRTAHYRAPAQDGFAALDLHVICSVCSPAFTLASEQDKLLRWRWQVTASPALIAFPTPRGVQLGRYQNGYTGRSQGVPSRKIGRVGSLAWTGRWMITFGGGKNVPLLWVFGGPRPSRIDVTTYEFMDVHFAQPMGRVSVMPLFGQGQIDRAELARLARKQGLAELAAWAEFWADVLAHLPDEVDEHFRINEHAGTIDIRNVGSRLDGKQPRYCPIPPFMATALERDQYCDLPGRRFPKCPIQVNSQLLTAPERKPQAGEGPQAADAGASSGDIATAYGPFRVAKGEKLQYTVPLCPYRDRILAPMRVSGDERAAELTAQLRAYMDDPKYTYGGDGTYDPDTLLDILHNLRVLGWATWAVADADRPAAGKAILRDFHRLFSPSQYVYCREPVTRRRLCRDRAVFDWCGDVTYDMDWYSGMNLAGLSLGEYFGLIPRRFILSRWALISDIAAYFDIFQDWATMVPWSDMRGELLNIDCCRHGMQGVIGLARLARRLGKRAHADRCEYLAARYMVYLAAEHVLPDVYDRLGVQTSAWGPSGPGQFPLGLGHMLEHSGQPVVIYSTAKSPYTLSPLSPEHMQFLREYGPVGKLELYESQLIDQAAPGWDTDPARVYCGNMADDSIEKNAGAYHFYMVDPHLFCRMLVLDWPSRKAIGRVSELSGQVMATALLADAPKVFCPAGVEFDGCEWDAAKGVLTIHAHALKASSKQKLPTLRWLVRWAAAPKSISGPAGAEHEFTNGELTLRAQVASRCEWILKY